MQVKLTEKQIDFIKQAKDGIISGPRWQFTDEGYSYWSEVVCKLDSKIQHGTSDGKPLQEPIDKPIATPFEECKCDMRTRVVGDGCEVCNPDLAKELSRLDSDVHDRVKQPRPNRPAKVTPVINTGRSITRVKNPMRFWIGWIQRSEDWRPRTFPPSQSILGYWKSGYAADGSPILFAVVEAEDAGKACYAVFQEWPEAKKEMLENGWRVFQHDKGGDWRPGDRFPLKDWMIERFEKRLVQGESCK